MTGTLYGLGVGPGDPDLITVKALRILQSVPVIAWPAPPEGESLARAIAAPHIAQDPIEIAIRMPLTISRFPDRSVYDDAAAQIGAHLAAGRDVAALCEGDPFFYGSFMYLFERIADRYPVVTVPGISSLTAAAAVSEAPLAARNDVLSVVPAPLPAAALRRAIDQADSVAIIKLGRHFAKVRDVLDELGLTGQARYVAHATMDNQTACRLDEFDSDTVPYFSMILVHKRGAAWR